MCIAILTLAGKKLDDDSLTRAFRGNSDGAGFAYIREGRVQVEKGFMSADAVKDKYAQLIAAKANEQPMLIHMRIATTGEVSRDNCHPFVVGRGQGNGAMIHNGSIYSGKHDGRKSDTRVLAERQRNNFNYSVVNEAIKELGTELGSYNKLVFLWPNGKYNIVNESQGRWYDGIWISNHHFKPNQVSPWTSRFGSSCGVNDI